MFEDRHSYRGGKESIQAGRKAINSPVYRKVGRVKKIYL
jgi:hypothetical protein